MSYVFLSPKKSTRGLKNVISGHFRFMSGEISEKFFWVHFYSTKRFVFEFQGETLEPFWAIVLIFIAISILEDFGSLLPACTVTVKRYDAQIFSNSLYQKHLHVHIYLF